MNRYLLVVCVVWLSMASADASATSKLAESAPSLAPADWDDIRLPEAQDLNPDQRIVEINLTAKGVPGIS